jgi:hypothetical protein
MRLDQAVILAVKLTADHVLNQIVLGEYEIWRNCGQVVDNGKQMSQLWYHDRRLPSLRLLQVVDCADNS